MLTHSQGHPETSPPRLFNMNKELYYGLISYLGQRKMPNHLEPWTITIINRTWKQFELDNTTLRKGGKIVIPEHKKYQVMKEVHEQGHLGGTNTYDKARRTMWWPKMEEDLRQFVKGCDKCQKQKQDQQDQAPGSSRIESIPFHHIAMDIIGPLPVTISGNRYIIVIVDLFTKWIEAGALQEANALSIADFLHREIICRYKTPRQITTDRGTEFINGFHEIMYQKYKIQHIKTTAYHPQGNGQTERTNKTLKNILAKISDTYENWDNYLPTALSVLRDIRSQSTHFTPRELLFGEEDSDRTSATNLDLTWRRVDSEIRRLHQIRKKAEDYIIKSQALTRRNAEKVHKTLEPIRIGEKVLLYRNMVEASWSRKLEPKWEGPFYVQEIKGTTFWLRKLSGTILPTTVHRNRLKKYHEPIQEKQNVMTTHKVLVHEL